MSTTQLMMTNDKKGVFQITVDFKSLQLKLQKQIKFLSSCYKILIQNGISKI